MCTFFGVSRSGYYDYVKRMNRPEKDAPLAALLRKQQEHCVQTYGYRRMHLWLERQGIHHNPKTVLKVMKNTVLYLKFGESGSGRIWDSKYINIKIYSTGSFMQTGPTANG